MDFYLDKDGWKYGSKKLGGLYVKAPKGQERILPSTLFKYYGLNDHSLEVLENLCIYAAHPNQMNDPWDTDSTLIDFDSAEAIDSLSEPLRGKRKFSKILNEKHKLKIAAPFYYRKIIYSILGVFSLTETHKNLLMWSYYTNHKGFCLEFDYEKFPFDFHGPFQINYKDKYQPIPISAGPEIANLYQITAKSVEWKHESEWRLLPISLPRKPMRLDGEPLFRKGEELHKYEPRTFKINRVCIKKIVLGVNFFDSSTEFVKSHQDSKVKVDLSNQSLKARLLNKIVELDLKVILLGKQKGKYAFSENQLKISKIEHTANLFNLIIDHET